MSKEVKRWGHHTTWEGSQIAATMMALRDDGQFVSWDDYEALLAERDALKQLLAETRTSMIEAIHWEDLTPVRKRIETALQGEQP